MKNSIIKPNRKLIIITPPMINRLSPIIISKRTKGNPIISAIMIPCSAQLIFNTEIPITNPIKIQLTMIKVNRKASICKPRNIAPVPQIIPAITPNTVAITILLIFVMFRPP